MNHEPGRTAGGRRLKTISWWVFAGFAAIAAYFLLAEHRAHLFGVLPYLLLAACPLLHFFHHSGHRRKEGDAAADNSGGTHHH
jgi:hypothetical protein